MSARPALDRSIWRCVPSPQSTRIRSPPRRTRWADGPRSAVGTAPAVPRKRTSRSMGRWYGTAGRGALGAQAAAPVPNRLLADEVQTRLGGLGHDDPGALEEA